MFLFKKNNFAFFVLSICLLQSCASRKPTMAFDKNKIPATPQHADLKNWAAHPDKKDRADLVPAGTNLKDEQATAEVDVFFLHPTTYTNKRGNDQWNGDVYNKKLNDKTDKGSIEYQASLFNGSARVFAPRYRQTCFQHLKTNFFFVRHSGFVFWRKSVLVNFLIKTLIF